MADLTSDTEALRCVVIQDPRLTFSNYSTTLSKSSAGAADLTQAGPLPGVPVAGQTTDMVLEATGTMDASTELRLRTIQSGHPGTDASRFVWRNDGDTLWRGWDPPTTITGFEFIDWSTTAGYWKWPHAVTTATGKIVAVAQREDRRVYCFTRSAAGTWGAGVEIYDRGSTYTNRASPCLVLLPSDRLLCFFWREKGTKASVWMYYSDDDGATWTVGSRAALVEPVDTSTYVQKRLRAAYLDGQIILLGHLVNGHSEEVHQWASSDLGSSFSAVDSIASDYGFPDVIAHNSALIVACLYNDGMVRPYVRRLGNAYAPISSATAVLATTAANAMEWGKMSGGAFDEGDLALWSDDDGSLYVAGLDHDAAGNAKKELMLARSADGGESWGTMGSSSAGNGTGSAVWFGHDANTFPTDFCVVSALGQSVLLSRHKADPATGDDSLSAMSLGGFSTVEIPELDALDLALSNRASWEMTWVPFELPGNMGTAPYNFGTATTGSGSETLTADGLRIANPGSGDALSHSISPTGAAILGEQIILVQVKVNAGGPTAFVEILNTNNTSTNTRVSVEVSPTAITFKDVQGGSTLATVATTAQLNGIQVLLSASAVATAKASAWYRPLGTDRAWVALATNQTVTTASLTTGQIKWGSQTGTSGNVVFSLACLTWATYAGSGLSGGQSNPDDLLGRAYMPTPVYVDGGTSLQAIDGPTFRNEVWTLDSRYEHAVDHVHQDVTPSPRRGWRSTDVTRHTLVWELSTTVSDVSQFTDDLIGLHLSRINWRTGSFWGRNSGGSWVKLFDIDAAHGQNGLKFTRNGSTIGPDPSGGSNALRWWPLDCLSGCHFSNGTQIRTISTNTSGGWINSATAATARQTRLILSDYATGDLTDGTAGAIWARDLTILHPVSASTTYSAYKLQIDAQSTASGDFRIGTVLIGPALVWGQEYDWGRGVGLSTSIQRTEGRGGTRSARQLAPVRRSVEIGWPGAVDTTGIGGDVPVPDVYRAHNGGPLVAGDGDALYMARGLLDHLSRTSGLVCYVDRFPVESSATTHTVTHRERHILGRVVTSDHRMDAVQGEEWVSEVLRGGRLRIEEEL